MRYTPGGHSVATLRLATNEREEPEFHDVVVWRNLAEAAAQYLNKGRLLYVEGRLHGRTWQAQDGTSRRHRRGDRRDAADARPACRRELIEVGEGFGLPLPPLQLRVRSEAGESALAIAPGSPVRPIDRRRGEWVRGRAFAGCAGGQLP
ncbi:MAG: single-stranded DNA-binding protein [Chloroflexota bacterium]